MNTFILLLSMLPCLQGGVQEPVLRLTDDILPEKTELLARHFPIHKKAYSYQFYNLAPAELQKRLQSFQNEALAISRNKDRQTQLLVQRELDFIRRETLRIYIPIFGMDSVGIKEMEKLTIEKKGDPEFKTLYAEARKKAFPKALDSTERKVLLNSVYKNPIINDVDLFKRSATYRSWLGNYLNQLAGTTYKNKDANQNRIEGNGKLRAIKGELTERVIKEYFEYQYTLEVMSRVKDPVIKKTRYDNFMASVKHPVYRKDVEAVYANDKMMTGNETSPSFNFQDADGKMVSLESLSGKYVYIDVWATWCAPCKAEIPFLQKVEHDYAGKKIHFVSLSVDRMADKGKWISYVKDNKLGGIQLMADKDFSSGFIKKYNINSIPRFILIDPQGKIVSGDAYRPSNPKLRTQLDQLL